MQKRPAVAVWRLGPPEFYQLPSLTAPQKFSRGKQGLCFNLRTILQLTGGHKWRKMKPE